jgi:ABC-type multidrug transport system fused ATPase/permease subunit
MEKNRPKEPIMFLMAKLIKFADNNKAISIYCLLYLIANLIMLLGPYIFGLVITEVQEQGVNAANIKYLFVLLMLIPLKELAFWLFHGVGRLIERMVAFNAEINYRRYLLKGVIDLDLSFHADKDSGDIIDRVNKAGTSLHEFGGEIFNIAMIIVCVGCVFIYDIFFCCIVLF